MKVSRPKTEWSFIERKDDGKEEKNDMGFGHWGFGVCCPKNGVFGSQSDIKNSSSNKKKNNLKRFILYRVERIRDWFWDLNGVIYGTGRELCKYLPEENVNLELEVEYTKDSYRS